MICSAFVKPFNSSEKENSKNVSEIVGSFQILLVNTITGLSTQQMDLTHVLLVFT